MQRELKHAPPARPLAGPTCTSAADLPARQAELADARGAQAVCASAAPRAAASSARAAAGLQSRRMGRLGPPLLSPYRIHLAQDASSPANRKTQLAMAPKEVLLCIDMQVRIVWVAWRDRRWPLAAAPTTARQGCPPLAAGATHRPPRPSAPFPRAQNDFCLPGAVLCVKGAMGCVPKVIEAVEVARSRGVPVIWVIREHDTSGGCCSPECCWPMRACRQPSWAGPRTWQMARRPVLRGKNPRQWAGASPSCWMAHLHRPRPCRRCGCGEVPAADVPAGQAVHGGRHARWGGCSCRAATGQDARMRRHGRHARTPPCSLAALPTRACPTCHRLRAGGGAGGGGGGAGAGQDPLLRLLRHQPGPGAAVREGVWVGGWAEQRQEGSTPAASGASRPPGRPAGMHGAAACRPCCPPFKVAGAGSGGRPHLCQGHGAAAPLAIPVGHQVVIGGGA